MSVEAPPLPELRRYCDCVHGKRRRRQDAGEDVGFMREDLACWRCDDGIAKPPPPPRDIWAALISRLDAGLQLPPTADVRQSAAGRRLRENVLAMVRSRSRQAGPLHASTDQADFAAAVDHHLDAMVRIEALLANTPTKHQAKILRLLEGQTALLLQIAAIVQIVDDRPRE